MPGHQPGWHVTPGFKSALALVSLCQLGGDASEVLSLEDGIVELQLGGLARAVGARQRAGAVGGAAAHLIIAEERAACG